LLNSVCSNVKILHVIRIHFYSNEYLSLVSISAMDYYRTNVPIYLAYEDLRLIINKTTYGR